MNGPIGESEEWQRLEANFFTSPWLQNMLAFDLSLDSFRPVNVRRFFTRLRELGFKKRCFWNDVAGIVDDEVFDLCQEFNLTYVYCHNEIGARAEVFNHAKTFGSGAIESRVRADLKRVTNLFRARGVPLIFDPCFGFSKRPAENYELLKAMPELAASSEVPLMIGISRKSFLRSLVPQARERSEQNQLTDQLQAIYFAELLRRGDEGEFYLRLHEPASFELARQAQTFLK